LTLAILAFYAFAMIAVGLYIGRKVSSASDFFVAGRSLSPFLLFSTLLAANIGAGSTVGAASLAYRDGIAAWWWVGSAGLGTFVLAFWVGPRIWKIASRHDLRTAGDFLELRYGRHFRGLVAVLLWLGTLAILAGQLIALAWVLHAVAGIPKIAGCLIGGLVMTTYFVAGGLLTSAWVNLVQLVVLLLGFVLALPYAFSAAGGSQALLAAPVASGGDFWSSGTSGWPLLFLLGPAFIVSPGLLQKIYGARDARAVRLGTAACAAAMLIFAAIPPLLGMAARLLHPELSHPDLALPTLLLENMPYWLGLLGLAAIVSAEVSTADALLFMLATSLSQDIYRRFFAPQADEKRVLTVARLAAVAGAVAGVGLAIFLPDVIAALRIFYSLLGICLFVPILFGLASAKTRPAEALAAVGAGIPVWLAARFLREHLPAGAFFAPDLLGLLASLLGFLTARFFFRFLFSENNSADEEPAEDSAKDRS
jgi:SSS family solute:Na+ symporter